VLFEGDLAPEDRLNLHYGEVGLQDGELVTAGYHGWTMVITGVGPTIAAAKEKAYALADRAVIPNVRYRRDIGDRLIGGDLAKVEQLGLLGDEPCAAVP
jgi:phosphoribosylamine---glycine ligase